MTTLDEAKSKPDLIAEIVALRQQVAAMQQPRQPLALSPSASGSPSLPDQPASSDTDYTSAEHRRANLPLRLLADYSPLMVVEWDAQFRVLHWSDEAARFFGWSAAEVSGKHPAEWPFIFEEDAAAIERIIERMLQGADRQNVGLNRNYCRDGSIVHCEWYYSAIYEAGQLAAIFSLVLDVTERRRAELALRASEERYRNLVEYCFEGVMIVSRGILVDINRQGAALLGADDPQVLIGTPALEIVHPKDQARCDQLVSQAVAHGRTIPLTEVSFRGIAGDYIDVEVVAVSITWQDRPAMQVAVRDITTRNKSKEEQARLLVAEREQRIITESLGEAFLTLTSQTSRKAVLDQILHQMERIVPGSKANIVLLEQGVLYPVRWRGYQLNNQFSQLSGQGQKLGDLPLDNEAVYTRKPVMVHYTAEDARWVAFASTGWIKSYASIPICHGERVLGLLRLDSDVIGAFTQREIERLQPLANAAAIALENARLHDQAREEIAERTQAEQALRNSEARNQALLGAIPDLIFRMSRAGIYLDCRPASNLLMKPTPGDVGQAVQTVLSAEVATMMLEAIAAVLDTEEPAVLEYQLPLPANNLGEIRLIDCETRLVRSGPDEVLGIVRDVTDRNRAERQIARSERLAALGQLAAALAHEINNPLQAVQSHLDLVLDFPLELKERDRYLKIVLHEIDRLSDVTRRILNYARPDSTERQVVSVAQIIEQVLTLTSQRLQENNVNLSLEFVQEPIVLASASQLTQVFLNLLVNAVEATGRHGHLAIVLDVVDHWAKISISNSGSVISDQDLPYIFEPFYTTKPDGSGLGLWVSRSLVQQHGGRLTVQNCPKQQSVVFSVELPLADNITKMN